MPTAGDFEAYWSRCEASIIDAMIVHLAELPSNADRSDYFDEAVRRAEEGLEGDDLARRLAFIKRLKRQVYAAMLEREAAAA